MNANELVSDTGWIEYTSDAGEVASIGEQLRALGYKATIDSSGMLHTNAPFSKILHFEIARSGLLTQIGRSQ